MSIAKLLKQLFYRALLNCFVKTECYPCHCFLKFKLKFILKKMVRTGLKLPLMLKCFNNVDIDIIILLQHLYIKTFFSFRCHQSHRHRIWICKEVHRSSWKKRWLYCVDRLYFFPETWYVYREYRCHSFRSVTIS